MKLPKSLKTLFLLLGLSTLLFNFNLISQENNKDCRVLLYNISGSYEGGCKKGLAHGKGIATGIDTYEGKFKNGFPHGQGVYTWKNSDVYDGNWKEGKRDGRGKMYYKSIKQDSLIYAYWIEDKFIKEIEIAPYEIIYRSSNLSRISFYKEIGGRNDIEFIIMRNGKILRNFNYIDFTGNSGVTKQTANYIGFENVIFPFEGSLRFKAANQMNTVVYEYILRFTISETASWRITINF